MQQRVADLERFAARLAHELTTPIVTIRGFSQVVRDAQVADPMVQDALQRIDRAAARTERILRTIVDETRPAELGPVELTPVLELVVEQVLAELGRSDVRISVHLDADATAFGTASAVRSIASQVLRGLAARAGNGLLDIEISSTVAAAADTVGVRFAAAGLTFTADELREIEGAVPSDDEEEGLVLLASATATASSQAGRMWCNDDEDGLGVAVVLALPRVVPSA